MLVEMASVTIMIHSITNATHANSNNNGIWQL